MDSLAGNSTCATRKHRPCLRFVKLAALFGSLVSALCLTVALYWIIPHRSGSGSSPATSIPTFVLTQVHLYNKTSGIRSFSMRPSPHFSVPSRLPLGLVNKSSTGTAHSLSLSFASRDSETSELTPDMLDMFATMVMFAYNENNPVQIVCDNYDQVCGVSMDWNGPVLITENNVVVLVFREYYGNSWEPVQFWTPTGAIVIAFKGPTASSFNSQDADDFMYACPSSETQFNSGMRTATGRNSFSEVSQVLASNIIQNLNPSAVLFTGHSLGGTLAMLNHAVQAVNSAAIVFSAPPSGLFFQYNALATGGQSRIFEFYTAGDPVCGGTSIVDSQCYPGRVGVYTDVTGCANLECHDMDVLQRNILAQPVPPIAFINDGTCVPCSCCTPQLLV